MNKKRMFAALLCTAALMTGCDADKAEESASEKDVIVYTQAVEENEEDAKDDAVIVEEPEMSADEAIRLYHRFQPLLGNYLVSDAAEEYIPPAEDCLFALCDAFDEKYEAVESSYTEMLTECSVTAYSNFMPEDAVHPASNYDPVTKLLYDYQDTMNVNPIALIRKLDTSERLEEEEEWHSFAYNYQAAHVETPPDVTDEEYVRSVLSNYTLIEKEKLHVGYSADEDLWYAYFLNLNPNQRSYSCGNLTISAFYFQFDEETGALAKCGTETYVRAADTLNLEVYNILDINALSVFMDYQNYFSAWSSRHWDGFFSGEMMNEWMEDVLMPDAHEANSEWVLGLLTKDGAVEYETSNHVKFTYADDYASAMSQFYAANAGHFVTWFECT